MAEYYIDVGAIGNEYQAYTDIPVTWGVPQDGNGKAKLSTASAVPVAEVTFAAIPTTGTINVYGVAVTLTGVLSAASTAAGATALASSINATTTATGSAVSALLLPLNKFVYARVKPGGGANDNIVQIMSRFAGSDLNYPENTSARVVNTFNNAAITSPVDFLGGTDGPWAYIFNIATVFGKTTLLSYGHWFAASPTVASPGLTDLIHVRTKRASANLAVELSWTGSSLTAGWRATNFLYDDGTVWDDGNSSGGQLTAKFVCPESGVNRSALFTFTSTSHESRSNYGLRVLLGSSNASSAIILAYLNGSDYSFGFIRCLYEENTGNIGTIKCADTNGGSSGSYSRTVFDFSGSKIKHLSSGKLTFLISQAGSVFHSLICNGLVWEVQAATGPLTGLISIAGSSQSGQVQWIGGRIYDTNGVYTAVGPITVAAGQTGMQVVLDSVTGITSQTAAWTASRANRNSLMWNLPEGTPRAYLYTTPTFTVDWKDDGSFPYCGAAADLRGVPWSHRVSWTAMPTSRYGIVPITFRYFFRGSAAVKTLTCEILTPDATAIYKGELVFEVSYVDSAGVSRTERTSGGSLLQFGAAGSALDSSATSWTLNGVSGYSAKRLYLTTSYAIKQNSEVTASLTLTAPKSPTIVIYISPEVGVA